MSNDDTTTEQPDHQESRQLALEWHPDALRPPFEWHVKLPTDWAVIETHPSRWKRQNERIVDDFFDGQRVPSKVRRELLKSLTDVVATAQQKKVLLTLVKPAIDEEGRIANLAMNLVFTSASPRLASMAPIKRAFGSNDTYAESTTPTGNAYGSVTVRRKQRDGSGTREVVSAQAFLPFAGTSWTLAVGVTTPQVDMEKTLHDLVVRCVSSVRVSTDDEDRERIQTLNALQTPPDLDDALALVDYTVTP